MINADDLTQAILDNVKASVEAEVERIFATNSELMTQLKVHAVNQLVNKIVFDENIEDIIGDKLKERFAEEFAGAIYSEAEQRELTIMDDTVVVENDLVARNAQVVEQAVTKNLTVTGDLIVTGKVDSTYPMAWAAVMSDMKREVTEDVVNNTKDEMVTGVLQRADELAFTDIKLDGVTVLSGNRLNNQITESNLLRVGTLRNLDVEGKASLNSGTLYVGNKRVGINTDSPTAGLNIWDEEVELVLGKLELQTAFMGTARSQKLKLGVNNIGHLTIDNTGMVRVEKFQIGERRIAFGSGIPSYEGKPGEIVFNTNFNTTNRTFAWICKGDFSWVPLKAEL